MKTALITGAYRGLGLEVARQLSARGYRVILTARRADVGQAAAATISNAQFLQLDITDAASVSRVAGEVPQLDVLINNAAILLDNDEDILHIPPEFVLETLTTNTAGALRVAQAFVPHLLKSTAGRIVNVSSGGGQLSDMGMWAPAYCISKTALNAVTCQLAVALKDKGLPSIRSVLVGAAPKWGAKARRAPRRRVLRGSFGWPPMRPRIKRPSFGVTDR